MISLVENCLPGTRYDPLYPDSDGRPRGETDWHSRALILLREGLEDFFKQAEGVYIASNIVFYFEQGNPSGRRDPDVLVTRGAGNHPRRSYRLWEEGKPPSAIFEISLEHTWGEDMEGKRGLYANLGVAEYFVFDPHLLYLDPPFQGFRTVDGASIPLTVDADGGLTSKVLGLRMTVEDRMLRLIDVETGKPMLTRRERADQLEAENARLRSLLARHGIREN